MKIISVDYHSVNCLSGVATFNRNLKKIFKENISFLTIYKKEKAYNIDEYCFNLPYIFFCKVINYITGYRLYSFLLSLRLNKIEADIVIFNSFSLLYGFEKKKNQKVYVVQHQDFKVLLRNKSALGGNWLSINKVFDLIDGFICLSDSDLNYIKNMIPECYHSKLIVISHSTEIDMLKEKKTSKKKLLMLGRLDNKQKRFDLILPVMSKLKDWSLSIYGDGIDKEKIHRLVNKYELTNVKVFDFTNDVKKVMDEHDIHVMTSDFEGFPITNIEAVTRGLPLIVRNTFTSAKDIVVDNGILLSSEWSEEEFINAVRTIELEYERYSENSVTLSHHYSFDIISKKWQGLLNK